MALATPEEIRDFDADQKSRKLHRELEAVLKRHQPAEYAAFAAAQLDWAFKNKRLAQIRPHHLLHSIEANCAYARGQNRYQVDRNRIARVMNIYHSNPEPLHLGLLEDEQVDLFFLALHREQMELQFWLSAEDVARTQELFVADNPLPKLETEFRDAHGLSLSDWVELCFLATVAADQTDSHVFHRDVLAKCEFHHVPVEQVITFLNNSSMQPQQIRSRFQALRNQTKPQFHTLIRSVFLQHPLMALENDVYLAPHPPLLLRHATHGLYRMVKQLPSFGGEFGANVQRYVGKVLSCADKKLRIFRDKDLERLSPGRSCDFLVEFDEWLLLIESKATTFVSDCLVEKVIRQDGSTGKIAEALEQLFTTAHDLHRGVFSSLSIDPTKPVVGVIATFGDIPFANSRWYLDNIILKRAESRLQSPIYPSANIHGIPIVMSLSTLELFVRALNFHSSNAINLYDEKAAQRYIATGDWDTFLKSKFVDVAGNQLPFITERCNEFWEGIRKRFPQALPME